MNSRSYILRFLFFVAVQVLILNQIELGFGIQLMIYPLFLFLLPIEIKVVPLMFIAFFMGIIIDSFSNTYGLHASASVTFVFARNILLEIIQRKEKLDSLKEINVHNMGFVWQIKTFGLLLFVHYFWFFFFEMFKLNELFYVLQKTILSTAVSFIIGGLFQHLFIRPSNKSR